MTSKRKTIFWALLGPVIWAALFLSVWSGEADGASPNDGFAPLSAREIAASAARESALLEASVTGCLASIGAERVGTDAGEGDRDGGGEDIGDDGSDGERDAVAGSATEGR